MVDNDDIGDVNLLEWSYELDRALLRLPFQPLQPTTDDGRGFFLYKLAYTSTRKKAGLLLLDCNACTAFYEGVSLRTLDRRTQTDTASLNYDPSCIMQKLAPEVILERLPEPVDLDIDEKSSMILLDRPWRSTCWQLAQPMRDWKR